MRTARRRMTLFLLATASVLAAIAVNLATGPALFGIPRWASTGVLVLLAVGFTYPLLSRAQPLAAEPAVDDVAERLAEAVNTRLAEELAVQDLNQRIPIAMRWRVADQPGRVRLSGDSTDIQGQITRRFNALRHRQVVVTGVAGAGKTVMAMWLTRGLNQCREPGGPVAVLVSVADWQPETEHLRAWLARQLTSDYGLTESAAESLVHRRIIPVLDGLDELPQGSRTAALHGIHHALGSSDPVAVTSRDTEFDIARDSTSVLPNVTRVDVEPVDGTDAAAFLRQGDDRGRWNEVIARVENEPDSVLASVLSTPLTVWLAKTIYIGRDPAELTDTGRFDTVERLTEHLVAGLVPAAYRRPPAAPGVPAPVSYDPDRAREWLAFLARHLDRLGTTEFLWWRLDEAVSHRLLRLSTALILTVVGGIASTPMLYFGYWPLAAAQVLIGLTPVLLVEHRDTWARRHWRLSRHGRVANPLRPTIIALILGGAVVGILIALALRLSTLAVLFILIVPSQTVNEVFVTFAVFVIIGLVLTPGLFLAFAARQVGDPTNTLPGAVNDRHPSRTLRRERHGMLAFLAFIAGTAPVMLGAFSLGADTDDGAVFLAASFLVSSAVLAALAGLWHTGSWCRYQSAKLALAVTGRLPWRLFQFLEDARRRGVLRRSSAAYQFRHVLLQDHLAEATGRQPARRSG